MIFWLGVLVVACFVMAWYIHWLLMFAALYVLVACAEAIYTEYRRKRGA